MTSSMRKRVCCVRTTCIPITFCEDCAPADGNLIPLTNSPRAGDANCYDNVHSWAGMAIAGVRGVLAEVLATGDVESGRSV